ncbi:hypothetical protein KM176_16620 [Pseudooceanicola sp. CBS1P-1]|uniref:XRE family transcriptional regulator n=1 Tax=Pseudooceanicola albus TaxID=2692189 RepID=A0A6L7G6E7_9RHOB|nr:MULTISPECIES: hypothetical protein [Pseudooceanicola]MBT9385500.1 hypothetical protein [Pseudooceanicola endophyticus]MXN19088.1 hypothetical protein [Pseudooceanicola albus]
MFDTIPEQDLIEKIEKFCETKGITLTDFGRLALNDTALVTTLKRGRELRSSTRGKIMSYLSNA